MALEVMFVDQEPMACCESAAVILVKMASAKSILAAVMVHLLRIIALPLVELPYL